MNEEQAIVTFLSGLVLACIGAYLAWRNGLKQRQAEAAKKFRDRISDVVTDLLDGDGNPTAATVRYRHDAVLSAVEDFRRYVEPIRRNSFALRVREYCQQAAQQRGKQILATLAAGSHSSDERDGLVKALQHLLSYAQQP